MPRDLNTHFQLPQPGQNKNEQFSHQKENDLLVDDIQLWKLFKSGNEGAFVKIYSDFVNMLYNLGKQFTYDHDLVKDCLQDFFIYLRTHRENLSDTDNIKLYLIKSFRRSLISDLKKQSKYFLSESSLNQNFFPVELSTDEKLINAQFEEEQLSKLNKGLNKLPVKEREALYYYFYQNLSYQEIAHIYHYDHISSARRLIYKSLHKLKELLAILFLCIFQ